MKGIDASIGSVTDCARRLGRDDVVDTLRIAAERAQRSQAYVVVMGEFKQGKSSLVNSLVGRVVCPHDDDTATAVVTLVEHAHRDAAVIHRDGTTEAISGTIGDADRVIRGLSESNVDHVRLAVADAELPSGLVMIDTPGIGGLEGGHTVATLAFLPYADVVLFVSDATAEYTAAEMSWIERVRDTGARIIPVLTKIDLAPSWRRILQLDTQHLARIGIHEPIIPTSAAVHQVASDVHDTTLAEESGIVALRELLVTSAVDPARRVQTRRAVNTARRMARTLAEQLRTETVLLDDRDAQAAAAAAAARARIEHLRGPASKWQQRLNDRSADIANTATFAFRAAMRSIGQSIDGDVEELSSPADWSGFARDLQMKLADAASTVFTDLDAAFATLRLELFELLAQEAGTLAPAQWAIDTPDVDQAFAAAQDANLGQSRALTAVRGAQSGVMLFGFLGQLLPAAAGALLLSSPITLVLGGAFAGKALLDVRRRSLTVRRTQLKTAARKVLDDAQFELGNRVSDHVRTSVRLLRDEVSDALALELRSQTDALAQVNELMSSNETQRSTRLDELRSIAADLRAGDAALAGAS